MESPEAALDHLSRAKAVLCDIDGCLCASNKPLPGAVAFAERLGERLYLVSNNSTHSREEMHLELKSWGLEVPPRRIVLAGVVAVETIAMEHPGCTLFLAGSNALAAMALDAGLHLVEEDAAYALLARDTAFDYARLQALVRVLEGGAGLYVSNPAWVPSTRSSSTTPVASPKSKVNWQKPFSSRGASGKTSKNAR